MSIAVSPPDAELLNDDFADAQVISGLSGFVRSPGTIDATIEEGEPPYHGGAGNWRSIWYEWTAPVDGRAKFDTCGSDQPAAIGVYTGESVDALTPVETFDSGVCGSGASMTFRTTAGTVYYLAVAQTHENDAGSVTLTCSAVAAPANDDFAAAEVLTGPEGETVGSNGPMSASGSSTRARAGTTWWPMA